MHDVSTHQLPRYLQLQRLHNNSWASSFTLYTRCKLSGEDTHWHRRRPHSRRYWWKSSTHPAFNCFIMTCGMFLIANKWRLRSWALIFGNNNDIWWRCPWCNGYCRRKWTRRHEFKSWTRQIAFHIALIPLGKVWIQLFSLQLWVNSRAD